MSIRLRLSLLFSTILALILVAFGISLYAIQSQYTLNWLKQDLVVNSETLGQSVLRTYLEANSSSAAPTGINPSGTPPKTPAPTAQPAAPKTFQAFSTDQTFTQLSESEIVRVLDPSGSLIASPYGSASDNLPLNEAGLAALKAGQVWWQTASQGGSALLIYNRPFTVNGRVIFILQVARSLTERDKSLQTLGSILLVAILVSIVLSFGMGWLLSGVALRPIHRITQTAKTIGAERDFTRRVSYSGPSDEVGQLAVTFNSMLSQLDEAFQKVAHALEMQRNFVADVSHELRTPLTTLRGNLGLLSRKPPIPAEEAADIVLDMEGDGDRLIRLVNDLLTLARADAGRNLAKEALAIRPLVAEAIRQVHLLDRDRLISSDVDETLQITGDRDAVKQVLLILLDNALKHSSGAISISADRVGSQVRLCVADRGAGLTPENLAHVFERFFRGAPALSGGSGLGLPIARALIEGQGGTITMTSQPGEGSQVTIFLPGVYE